MIPKGSASRTMRCLILSPLQNRGSYSAGSVLYSASSWAYNGYTDGEWRIPGGGGLGVTVRERVLAIRLIERQEKDPEYFKALGVHVSMTRVEYPVSERRTQHV